MTAAEKILQKALVTSGIGADEWNSIQAGFRDRSFFSARVTEVRILDAMRGGVAESLSGNLSASEFRKAVREALFKTGYDAGDARGTIKDLMTKARLDLVYNTNREMAQGFVQHLQATSEGALAAFPAYELVRAERRKAPRNWPEIWKSKGGKLYQDRRMIALKTDPIWTRISRFGIPHPPFDYNSGMDLVSVSRGECLALGVIDERTPKQKPPKLDFNENLQATVPMEDGSPEAARLKAAFGDQVKFDGNVAHWQGELIRDVFDGRLRSAKLGRGYDGRNLSISHSIIRDHISKHVGGNEKDSRNMPLSRSDFELIPAMWRKPDRVAREDNRDHLEFDAFDGGVLHLIVDPVKGISTFYKQKRPGGA